MKDYSEYLKQEGVMEFIEKSWTTECKEIHDSYAKAVNDTLKKFKLKSVIEIGCGTGEVARRLKCSKYKGIDANEECVSIAFSKKTKPADVGFVCADIRDVSAEVKYDIVCAFSVLKHFGLHEWEEIFSKVCSLGKYLIFNMPMNDKDSICYDDGTGFHHLWVTYDSLRNSIVANGFEILEVRNDNPIEPIFICKRKENTEA